MCQLLPHSSTPICPPAEPPSTATNPITSPHIGLPPSDPFDLENNINCIILLGGIRPTFLYCISYFSRREVLQKRNARSTVSLIVPVPEPLHVFWYIFKIQTHLVLVPVPVGPGLGELAAELTSAGPVLVDHVVQAKAVLLSDD